MKKIIAVVLFVFMFFMPFGPLHAEQEFRLLVFGDSLSAGYGVGKNNSFATLLQKELHKNGYKSVQVVNRSKSGETTMGGLIRLPLLLKEIRPNGVIIELGINDVFKGNSVSTIRLNLERMIKICQEHDVAVLLAGMKAPPYAGEFYQKEFNAMYEELAVKYNLVYYPFFMKGVIALEDGIPVAKYVLPDNIHPNVNGIMLMVKNMLPVVERFLKLNNVMP